MNYNALTYRQANGRLHRIGQTQPVRIYFPVYAATAQKLAYDHLTRKVEVSAEVDGLSVESALEAVGAGTGTGSGAGDSGGYLARQTAMSLGRAIYEMLIGAKIDI